MNTQQPKIKDKSKFATSKRIKSPQPQLIKAPSETSRRTKSIAQRSFIRTNFSNMIGASTD